MQLAPLHLALFTKLRPHAHEFLAAASKICQLYVYTMVGLRV
jgi:hypothetical protein